MPGEIATLPRLQFNAATGAPLVSGTLTSYLSGSTTKTPTWQDQALTIENTNPIVLDSRGSCLVWLDNTKTYKIVLADKNGVVIWTQDNVVGGGVDASVVLNAGLIQSAKDEAAASAAEALGYLQAYRATSYGALAADPALDPLGNAPTAGDEYFNTTSNLLKRFNGTAWQVPDINTTNLAAAGGAGLVGYLAAGVGAIPTTVEAVLRESVSITSWCTLNNPAIDNAAGLEAAFNFAITTGVKLTSPVGDLYCARPVVIQPAVVAGVFQKNLHVDLSCMLVFPAGSDGFFIGNFEDSFLNFAGVRNTNTGDIRSNTGFAFKKGTLRNTDLKVGRLKGFKDGFINTSTAGDYYNHIDLGGISVSKTNGSCIHISTEFYSNENTLTAKFLSGWKGITSDDLTASTFKNYSGWKFYNVGFEDIEYIAWEPKCFYICTLVNPRFEGANAPSDYWINEDATNSRNTYILSNDVPESKTVFLGAYTRVIGRLMDLDANNTIKSNGFTSSASSADRVHDVITIPATGALVNTRGSRTAGNLDGGLFGTWAGFVVDGNGIVRKHGLLNPYTYNNIGNVAGETNVDPYASLITVSSSAGAVVLKMPVRLEMNGFSMLLHVPNFTNTISIKKSTDAVTVAAGIIVATGLYQLVYLSEAWRVTKIGEKLST